MSFGGPKIGWCIYEDLDLLGDMHCSHIGPQHGNTVARPLALFDISLSNIDCRYIDTFEKYRYRYGHS